jgi:hypothetical protein
VNDHSENGSSLWQKAQYFSEQEEFLVRKKGNIKLDFSAEILLELS